MYVDNREELETQKIIPLLFKFSLPAIMGTMISALYNIVDRIFIGNAAHVGKNGLAGLTVSFPIMIILMSVAVLFGIGGATLYSIHLGRKERDKARLTLVNVLVFLVISSLVLMMIGLIFLDPILILFGSSQDVLPYAKAYMSVIFCGALFQIVSTGLNNFIRADGEPRTAMFTMLIGAVTNIVLDALFIFGFKMGMEGAALATIIAQFASMVWTLAYFLSKKNTLRVTLIDLKPQVSILIKVIKFGVPGFILQLGNSLLNLTINRSLLLYGGDNAVSTMGVVNSVQTFIMMPIFGLNQGVKPIVSYNFGARKFDRIRETMRYANITAVSFAFLGWLLTRLFPLTLVRIFNQDAALLELGAYAVNAWFLALPVLGFQVISSNFFQAVGHTKTAIFLTLIRTILLPLPIVLLFSSIWGLDGIFYAAPVADTIAVIVTASWYYFGIHSLEKFSLKKIKAFA